MGVPKKAKWNAETVAANSVGTSQIQTSGVESTDIKDAAVTGAKLLSTDDYEMGTLETTGKVKAGGGTVTKHGTGGDILIATLTTAFGNPTGLDNGALFTYKDTTANKYYLVVVIGSAFYLEELTAAAAL